MSNHLPENSRSTHGFDQERGDLLDAVSYVQTIPEDLSEPVDSGDDSDVQTVQSPDGTIEFTIDCSSGVPKYSVARSGTTYIDPSPLGFDFAEQPSFGSAIGGRGDTVTIHGSKRGSEQEEWTPYWGDVDTVSQPYNFLTLGIGEVAGNGRTINLEIRVFNDGLGFRIVFGETFGEFALTSENTEFDFSDDYTAWWIENEFINPRFESEYIESDLSDIPAGEQRIETDGGDSPNGNVKRLGVHTPLTMKADDGTYLSVHEANLDDYASMSISSTEDTGSPSMAAELAPLPDGTKVSATAPHVTPWRTVQLGDTAGSLIESQLIPLLADPIDTSAFPTDPTGEIDTTWVSPRKYVGIWWMMIAGQARWEYKSDETLLGDGQNPGKHVHGARTERMKRHMTFASEHGLDSVLVEGWNQGWESYPGDGSALKMGLDGAYPDFDISDVLEYGATLDDPVEMMMHNESAGNLVNYERQITDERIFEQYEQAGIRSIKNGYVSDPGLGLENSGSYPTHNQHCQTAVNHHRAVIKNAAKNRQMLEIHEGIKPTGEIRTYPNVGCREVVKAQEFDGFGALQSDVGRDHHVLLPYTRMLAGPTSYQPGIFDIDFSNNGDGQIQTTRAKQLAMYPTYLSGLQMAADRIEAYIDQTVEVGEFVQAQSATLDGIITEDTWRHAYGAHYTSFDATREPVGASLSVTIKNVETPGTYDLHFRYAADAEDTTQAVHVNGHPEATLVVNGDEQPFTPQFTEYWDDWQIHTVTADLDAGENTITLKLGPDDVGGFNLNTVGVSEQNTASPVAADYTAIDPRNENYDTKPEFEFIKNTPTSWDETVIPSGEIGEYIVSAKRKDDEWFLGAMTNNSEREITLTFDFLDTQPNGWSVTQYADSAGTDVDTNPTDITISEYKIQSGESTTLSLPASGGTAMEIRPAEESN